MSNLLNKIICGDASGALQLFPSEFIDCIVTSPPYWGLRDYGSDTETIWDADNTCDHQWVGKQGSAFCFKCSVWRGQLGLEPDFQLYIKHLCDIFDEVKRVLNKTGTCWVNLGDTYGGSKCGYGQHKDSSGFQNVARQGYYATSKNKSLMEKVMPKSLIMIPSRFAIEMCNRGWILRNVIVWHKPNCLPSSVRDRFTVDFEYLLFFTKSRKYYFKTQYEPAKESSIRRLMRAVSNKHKWAKGPERQTQQAINRPRPNIGWQDKYKRYERSNAPHEFNGADHLVSPFDPQKGRNKRCVWTIPTKPFKGAHFAVYPEKLIETPILAGCPEGGIVLDPFCGSGTTCLVAKRLNRRYIGIDASEKYTEMARKRIEDFDRLAKGA